MTVTYHLGDTLAVAKTLPSESVHTIITSPPYFGLRNYGVDGQMGLEATIDEYVTKMVELFREYRRVLRSDGTFWLNIGDSYAVSGGAGSQYKPGGIAREGVDAPSTWSKGYRIGKKSSSGLKPKDLCLVPFRLALALQADGWHVRSDIVWAKPNPMPESVKDRPTRSHEYIFLLTKTPNYFFDSFAWAEPVAAKTLTHRGGGKNGKKGQQDATGKVASGNWGEWNHPRLPSATRNRRDVWTITTKPFREAHFATFPPDLVQPMIVAATSEHGVCGQCGEQYARIIERPPRPKVVDFTVNKNETTGDPRKVGFNARWAATVPPNERDGGLTRQDGLERTGMSHQKFDEWLKANQPKTIGWASKCGHAAWIVPATVLDPFSGAGTTQLVAERLGRNSIYIDLNPEYLELAKQRIGSERTSAVVAAGPTLDMGRALVPAEGKPEQVCEQATADRTSETTERTSIAATGATPNGAAQGPAMQPAIDRTSEEVLP